MIVDVRKYYSCICSTGDPKNAYYCGTITEARINQSVRRILKLEAKY